MSARSFFDLRYAVPGYTFILILLLINVLILQSQLQCLTKISDVIGILLGFLTLLSGQPIGFLVSQIWYSLFDRLGWRSKVMKEPFEILVKNNHVLKEFRQVIFDYLMNSEKNQNLRYYLDRRWDLGNLLGSTAIAVLLSGFFGYLVRLCFFLSEVQPITWTVYDLGIIIILVILFLSLWYNTRRVLREDKDMSVLIIRSKIRLLKKRGRTLRDMFPKEYFSGE